MKWNTIDTSMTFGRELLSADSEGWINLEYTIEVNGNTTSKYGINRLIKDINKGIKLLEEEKKQLREMKKEFYGE